MNGIIIGAYKKWATTHLTEYEQWAKGKSLDVQLEAQFQLAGFFLQIGEDQQARDQL